jgi:predicted 3-demethylubiquinone-9 3-methyltransferase (glyoxalase superfamily)
MSNIVPAARLPVEGAVSSSEGLRKKEQYMAGTITPFLWFDANAEEATNFYVSVFPNSEVLSVNRLGPEGKVLTTSFRLDDQVFVALNGGPYHRFSEAVSFVIDCESQEEVDHYWDALSSDGGEPEQCGWLKDRYGLSWQVVPRAMVEMLQDEDAERAGRVMQAMLQMTKIEIATLRQAYDG